MGKVKNKASRRHTNHHDDSRNRKQTVTRRGYSQPPVAGKKKTAPSSKQDINGQHQRQLKLKIPFQKHDRVLLVGEGNFSFTLSLFQHHGVQNITATCLDGEEELRRKYPRDMGTVARLLGRGGDAVRDSDALCDEVEWNGCDETGSPPSVEDTGNGEGEKTTETIAIHYGVNATKLSTTHKKLLRPYAPFTKIIFNFPHVGGLSTDVNRQVRANQELLVGFFNAAKSLLTSEADSLRLLGAHAEQDDFDYDVNGEAITQSNLLPSKGQILVTLFEGEPYVLWNIRDLARHCGLRVVESFKFPWDTYPGYKHARTIGEITTGMNRSAEGKRKGAWRGEERDARCFVFEVKDEVAEVELVHGSATGGNMALLGKRRKGNDREDNEDSD